MKICSLFPTFTAIYPLIYLPEKIESPSARHIPVIYERVYLCIKTLTLTYPLWIICVMDQFPVTVLRFEENEEEYIFLDCSTTVH